MKTRDASAHRSGPLKQQNKTHKTGRHRSKSQIDKDKKGKTNLQGITKKTKKQLSRVARKHRADQLRALKRSETVDKKRGLGEPNAPPFLVTIISLCNNDKDAENLLSQLLCDPEASTSYCESGITYFNCHRFKQRFSFILPRSENLYDVLDTLKVADTALLIWPKDGDLDENAANLLCCAKAHGLPTYFNVVKGMSEISGKKKEMCRRVLTKSLESWSLDSKFYSLDSNSDALVILRQIGFASRKSLNLQKFRTHLLVESFAISDEQNQADDFCEVKFYGYIRGPSLDVNSLVHITDLGTFQMNQIQILNDPRPLNLHRKENKTNVDVEMNDESSETLIRCDPSLRTSLESEVTPDPMKNDQTWPTDQEIKEAELLANNNQRSNNIKAKKVPVGTSTYQASWILDEDDAEQQQQSGIENEESGTENDDNDENEEEDETYEMNGDQFLKPKDEVESQIGDEDENMNDTESVAMTETDNNTEKYDVRFDEEEEKKLLRLFREERENQQFPDEIDTPLDIPARTRFQRYRGLKSFRTSPWNKMENLPYDYARIFQFENFRRTKKRVLTTAEEKSSGVTHGKYVCIYVEKIPKIQLELLKQNRSPIVVYGLLPHEQKISLVNFVIRKHDSYTLGVKAKDQLIFHVGYRRFKAAPIFSQHTNGDKFKYERFLPADSAVVASVYAPVIFPPCTVLVFKNDSKGRHRLVATGAVLDVNPNRVVVKRIVLSGDPFKIHKRGAVVRHMFFNREDIDWFKPVELRSKFGRRGHIKEALGTHGHMKCLFDRPINSQDTVLMDLYKRVFPKWTYESKVPRPVSNDLGIAGLNSSSTTASKSSLRKCENYDSNCMQE